MGIFEKRAVKETICEIEKLFGRPLSEETLESGFLESLNPLRISPDCISSSVFSFSVYNDVSKISNNLTGFICTDTRTDELYAISFCEEGLVLKYKDEFYYRPFSDVSLKVKQQFKTVDFDYSVKDPIYVLSHFLKSNYIYHYKERGTRTIVQFSNTAHLKKDGTLDKRYTKQNNSTSVYTSYSKVDFDENLIVPDGLEFCCIIDGGFLRYSNDNLNEFCDFVVCICNFINKNLSDVIIQYNYGGGILLLSDVDRSNIKNCLNKDYKSEIKFDKEAIRAEYEENFREGRYKVVTISNGVKSERPVNRRELEEMINDAINKANEDLLQRKQEAAKELLDEIIKSRRSEAKENSPNKIIGSMTFEEFAMSKGIDLNKFKKDRNNATINIVRKSSVPTEYSSQSKGNILKQMFDNYIELFKQIPDNYIELFNKINISFEDLAKKSTKFDTAHVENPLKGFWKKLADMFK